MKRMISKDFKKSKKSEDEISSEEKRNQVIKNIQDYKSELEKIDVNIIYESIAHVSLFHHYLSIEPKVNETKGEAFAKFLYRTLNPSSNIFSYQVKFLGGENNPVLLISRHDLSGKDASFEVVMRFVQFHDEGIDGKYSSQRALSRLQKNKFIAKQYEIRPDNKNDDSVYIELSEYCSGGNLHDKFKEIHSTTPQTNFQEIQKQVLEYAEQLIEFVISLPNDIVFTDFKPSNFLLINNQIKVSDTKTFMEVDSPFVATKDVLPGTSGGYFNNKSLCGKEQKIVDLHKLLQQQLAVTIYELLTIQMPEKSTFGNHFKFNFNLNYFSNNVGQNLKSIIRKLAGCRYDNLNEVLAEVSATKQADNANKYVLFSNQDGLFQRINRDNKDNSSSAPDLLKVKKKTKRRSKSLADGMTKSVFQIDQPASDKEELQENKTCVDMQELIDKWNSMGIQHK